MKPNDRDNVNEAAKPRVRPRGSFDDPRSTPLPVRATLGPAIEKWLLRTDSSIRPMSKLLTITHALHGTGDASGRLLVVEDDPDSADSLADALAETGYEVTTTGDGQEALDHVRGTGVRPDLVLLDLRMPVMDGHAFLAARASDPLLADVPVIVISGQRATKASTDVFARIEKPIALLVLLEAVQRALHGSAPAPSAHEHVANRVEVEQ
jgi:CheY-like chemotaxis protein